jgi:hypothetical protein
MRAFIDSCSGLAVQYDIESSERKPPLGANP